jgi:segregation and condensation protein B
VTHDPVPSQESLAQQAASWVPPWQREPDDALAVDEPDDALAVEEPEPEPEFEPEPAAEAVEPDIEPEPEPAAEAVVDPEPEPYADADADAEPEAEAESEPVAEAFESEAEPETVAEAEPVAVIPAQAAAPLQEQTQERQQPEPQPLTAMDQRELISALEAILMVVDEPVGEILLAQVMEQPADVIALTLRDMSREYAEEGRGFDLRQAAGGWRFYTRDRYASYVERFVLDGQSVRLTQAALETLAVVAYKQPVTRSRISAIRGVNCDGVVRTLISRGLIEECGSEPESGAHLYRTTGLFLEKLGLDSVAQLPPLAPFLPDNVEEIADAER